MHQKVASAHGRDIHRHRKLMAEPVFGQIKQALGFRQFSFRGLAKVAAESGIVCLCHKLLKLSRAVGSVRALAS
jgi:DDE family transposase